jgi:hypothetical protein
MFIARLSRASFYDAQCVIKHLVASIVNNERYHAFNHNRAIVTGLTGD